MSEVENKVISEGNNNDEAKSHVKKSPVKEDGGVKRSINEVGDDSNSVIDGLGDDSNSNTQTKPSLPRNNKKQKHEEEKEDDEDNLDEEDCLDEEDGSEGDLDGGDGVYDEEDDDDDPVLVKKAGELDDESHDDEEDVDDDEDDDEGN